MNTILKSCIAFVYCVLREMEFYVAQMEFSERQKDFLMHSETGEKQVTPRYRDPSAGLGRLHIH